MRFFSSTYASSSAVQCIRVFKVLEIQAEPSGSQLPPFHEKNILLVCNFYTVFNYKKLGQTSTLSNLMINSSLICIVIQNNIKIEKTFFLLLKNLSFDLLLFSRQLFKKVMQKKKQFLKPQNLIYRDCMCYQSLPSSTNQSKSMVPEICLNYENQNYWSISQT